MFCGREQGKRDRADPGAAEKAEGTNGSGAGGGPGRLSGLDQVGIWGKNLSAFDYSNAAIGNGSETVYISAGSYENGGNGIIELEEGRLWFLVEGQRLDITDQVDEKTPYVWTRWERNGDLHYVLVGGTPEDYGWAEGIKFANGEGGGTGTLHSREDIPWEEFIQDPDWYGVGLSQVEELWESQNG